MPIFNPMSAISSIQVINFITAAVAIHAWLTNPQARGELALDIASHCLTSFALSKNASGAIRAAGIVGNLSRFAMSSLHGVMGTGFFSPQANAIEFLTHAADAYFIYQTAMDENVQDRPNP